MAAAIDATFAFLEEIDVSQIEGGGATPSNTFQPVVGGENNRVSAALIGVPVAVVALDVVVLVVLVALVVLVVLFDSAVPYNAT